MLPNFGKFLKSKPLSKTKITQPFGVDWSDGMLPLPNGGTGNYKSLGLDGHNGIDFSLHPYGSGALAYAVADGEVSSEGNAKSGYGLNLKLIVDLGEKMDGLVWSAEIVYGHLMEVLKTGKVRAGEPIAKCDNSGISTGPHLHFGLRFRKKSTTMYNSFCHDYNNGYFGYVDPTEYFTCDINELPVDRCYGLLPINRGYSELEWYKIAYWIWRRQGYLPTTRQKNAIVWGRWDWRTISDPSMLDIWMETTKMEWLKKTKSPN